MSRLVHIDLNPSCRTLRQFGWIAGALFCAASVLAYRDTPASLLSPARELAAAALAGIGVSSVVFSLAAPRANRPLFVALSLAAFPVGFVVSHLLLALVFFGIFTPLALALRLAGRDALQRRAAPRAESYWTKARPPRPLRDYFRQF